MNLCLRLAMSWVGRRVFTPPDPPVAVAWQSVTANGSDGATTSTQLTFTFDVDPGEVSAANFTIDWATKGTMTGTGTTRVLPISDITADNNTSQTVTLASNPSGYTITPTSRSVTVYVQDVAVEWQSLTANGTPGEVTTTELTLGFDADPGPLTTGSFILFNADITGISGTGTGRVLTINNIVSTELTLSLTSPAGYDIDPSVLNVSVSVEDTVVPITITLQPTTQTVDEGNDATFTLDYESAETVAVQWVFGGSSSGTDSKTFVVSSVVEAQNATPAYAILDNGTTTVQTDTVYLQVTGVVDENIYITQQPVSRTVNEGEDVTFTVAYESELPATVQWKDADDDSDLIGEQATSITYSDVMAAESGSQRYLRITNSAGFVDTNVATLTVLEAGVDPLEPSIISNFTMLPRTGTETDVTFQPTSKVVYVDQTNGNNATAQIYTDGDFLNMRQPGGSEMAFKDIDVAYANVESGESDIVLLKRGEKWNVSGTITTRKGKSLTERHYIADYGNPMDAKPIINKSNAGGGNIFRFWRDDAGNHVLLNLDITWDRRNPLHPDFDGIENITYGDLAINCYKDGSTQDHSGIWIEGCSFSHFIRMGSFVSGDSTIPTTNLVLRNNTISYMYRHEGGAYPSGVYIQFSEPLLEGNIFVNCGWLNLPGINNGVGGGGDFWRPIVYGHSIYLSHVENFIDRDNLSIDPATTHHKCASWGIGGNSVERVNYGYIYRNNNIGGEVVHSVVDNPDGANNGTRARNVYIDEEVTTHLNEEQNNGRDLGWGTRFWDIRDGHVKNCIYAHINNASVTGVYAGQIEGWATNVEMSGNIAYNANGAEWKTYPAGQPQTNVVLSNNIDDGDSVAVLVDPDRDLYSYMVANSIGDGTDRQDYIDGVLNYYQTGDSRFSPTAYRDYIRAGFAEDVGELNEIAFSGLTANGTTGTTTTDTLTLSFDEDPTGLAASDITVTGATKGALSGTGTTRSLAISAITVADSETVNVAIANNNGNTFSPTNRDVTVYKEAANEIAFNTLTANGTTETTTTDTLTLGFDEDPTGLAAGDITVTGATKGALSGTGLSRTLAISAITVADSETVNVAIADNNGNTFSPTNRDVTVYKEVAAFTNKFASPFDFSTDWTVLNLGTSGTVSANVTGPDGSTSVPAYREFNTAEHRFAQTIDNASSETISCYFKYIDMQYVGFRFRVGDFTNVVFDIQNGTVFSGTQTNVTNVTITDAGDGWYRCSATLASRNNTSVSIATFSADGTAVSYDGSGFREFYAFGALLTDGTTLYDLI